MFDVTVTKRFAAAPEKIASIMFDPSRDPEWIGGVEKAMMLTGGLYDVGARIRREGKFLGREIAWVTETTAYDPGEWTEMCIIEGPFSGDVEYRIKADSGGAMVTLINRGAMANFPDFIAGPVVRMGMAGDLKRLAAIVE